MSENVKSRAAMPYSRAAMSTNSLACWPLVAKTIRVLSTMRDVTTLRALAAKHQTDA